MDLRAAVEKYREVVREFGRPMPLAQFGLPQEVIEAMVSAWDEDYHLHAHFELISAASGPEKETVYRINGRAYTAIVFRPSIRHVFE